MTVLHLREEWQDPAVPVVGPAFEWDTHQEALHYTADDNLPDGDPGEPHTAIPAYLRSIQRFYTTDRGYSIGYNWAVDQWGDIWQLRGWDFECAANKGHNAWTYAILMLVDGQDPATPEALRAARYIHAEAERLSGRIQTIRPHSQLKSDGTVVPFPGGVTSCPGNGNRALMVVPGGLQGGKFNWRYAPVSVPVPPPIVVLPPQPVPPASEEEDIMVMVRFEGFKNVFHHGGGGYSHLAKESFLAYQAKGVPLVVCMKAEVGYAEAYDCALAQSRLGSARMLPTADGS
jgi:hypothetical protein